MTEPQQSTLTRLAELARTQPDTPAYCFLANGVEVSARLSYAQLLANVTRTAHQLRALQLQGRPIVLVFQPGLPFVVAFWACLAAGAIAIPTLAPDAVSRKRALPRLRSIIQDVGATAVLCGELADVADLEPAHTRLMVAVDPTATASAALSDDIDPDQPAYLQYTSGSTSEPKGVVITRALLARHLATLASVWDYSPQARSLTWMPHSHDYGLVDGLLTPVFAGATCHLMASRTFIRDPLRWLRAIGEHRITHSAAPPFAFQLCRQALARSAPGEHRFQLDSWRVASTGAEPISGEVLRAFARELAPHGFRMDMFWPAYGLAEATLLVTTRAGVVEQGFSRAGLAAGKVVADADGARLVSCGPAITGATVVIVDPTTHAVCADDAIGEVWIDSDSRCHQYWNKPDASRELFAARLGGEPVAGESRRTYLRSGDLGFLRDGELYICGRLKDVLIVNGENIHAPDVEQVVRLAVPELADMSNSVFRLPSEGREHVVLLQEVDLRQHPSLNLHEARARVQQAVFEAFGFTLREVGFVKPRALPRTTSGKMQRTDCRLQYLAGTLELIAPPAQITAPASARVDAHGVQQHLCACLEAQLALPANTLQAQRPFADLGMDSASVMAMVAALEDRYAVGLVPQLVWEHPTPARLAAHIAARAQATSQDMVQLFDALEQELADAG